MNCAKNIFVIYVFIVASFSGVFFAENVAAGHIQHKALHDFQIDVDDAHNIETQIKEQLYSDIAAGKVYKFVLENGLTILVVPRPYAAQVSMLLLYRVGSRHESSGERGMAHFIEHMVFKGTKEMLSEVDIPLVSHKLSTYCNAFTWYDYTGYVFNSPLVNWTQFLPVFADCMQNCRFLQDHMNSEIKAVMQELSMRRDMHALTLLEEMFSAVFAFHPYHNLCIGVKQDLWNFKQETLVNFYKKYYVPQNAVLVLVGALDPDEAFAQVSQVFTAIPGGPDLPEPRCYIEKDIQKKSIVLYRDVKQPIGALAFMIPGRQERINDPYEILAALLCNGDSSRLHKKLVDELGLVTSISFDMWDTLEYDMGCILFDLQNSQDFQQVKKIIQQELCDIAEHGFSHEEIERACKQILVERENGFEQVYGVAKKIGLTYLIAGDKLNIFGGLEQVKKGLADTLQQIARDVLRPSLCHEGIVCPVDKVDKAFGEAMALENAKKDAQELQRLERHLATEAARHVHKVVAHKYCKKEMPKPEVVTLDNGLEVLLSYSDTVDKVDCVLRYRADRLYDPAGQEGMSLLVANMMQEGTSKYPGTLFKYELARHGILLDVGSGAVAWSCLSQDAYLGLERVSMMFKDATFELSAFENVKNQQKMALKAFWDDPRCMLGQKAKEAVYKNHFYGRLSLGSDVSVDSIDRDTCFDFYKNHVSAHGACLAVVGKFDRDQIIKTIGQCFGTWSDKKLKKLEHPKLESMSPEIMDVVYNRNQVFMAFVGLSVTAKDVDINALRLFDNILLKSMGSKMFAIREKTGLFYFCYGSAAEGAWHEPGMFFVGTAVAPDRAQEAYDVILDVILTAADQTTDEEFDQAKELEINRYPVLYELNRSRAKLLLDLHEMGLPFDYYEKQVDSLRNMQKEEMIAAVKKIVSKDKLACIRIGTF